MQEAGLIPAFGDGLRIPARFVSRAYIDRLPDRTLRVTDQAFAAPADLGDYTAIICDGGAYHYFHFMEAMIWLWVIQHAFLFGMAPARLVFANPWDNPAQNRVQIGVVGALYPGVSLVDLNGDWPAMMDNVLVFDRSWAGTTLNKILQPCMGFARPHVVEMARRVRNAVGAFGGRSAVTRCLHVTRTPPRCLAGQARAELLQVLQRHAEVTEVDFAGLPWPQQVRVAACHDVLVGVHGNGLTNALWMRPGSLVLEIFPAGAHHYDYQFFAELCGIDYFGFEGDNLFPAFCRLGLPYGHNEATNKGVFRVAGGAVERVVDAWCARRWLQAEKR
jgi:hypothetical protein